jgi:hypothetical protein
MGVDVSLRLARAFLVAVVSGLALCCQLAVAESLAQVKPNQPFPAPVERALETANSVTLYALEPEAKRWSKPSFQGWHVLGLVELKGRKAEIAIAEFRKAIANPGGFISGCIEPREALRVRTGAHTYDLVLCFSCAKLLVLEGNNTLADLTAIGSRDTLKRLLAAEGVPISRSDEKK